MRRRVLAGLLLVAGPAMAAEPTTQPSSVIDLPTLKAAAGFHLSAVDASAATVVRGYGLESPRYNVGGAFPATLDVVDGEERDGRYAVGPLGDRIVAINGRGVVTLLARTRAGS